jgi:hypothetical protein
MTTQYKWLPKEPTDEMLSAARDEFKLGTKPISADLYSALIAAWQAVSEIEQGPVAYLVTIKRHDRLDARLVYKLDDLVLNEATKIVSYEPLYTHPQADQTLLINQLTEELNKTEAARVKWMTMALTSQPKRATKDHEIAKFVSELTAIANEYQGTQQLRNRLRGVVLNFIEKYKSEPLNEIELRQIFEQSIGLKYWDFAKAIEKANGIGV